MDGIARLQIAPGEHRIGVQREIADRERADAVEYPDRKSASSDHRTALSHREGATRAGSRRNRYPAAATFGVGATLTASLP